ncbi:MAG: alpha/beta fold hydrolase [Bacteroidota bacterium]
MKTKIFLFSLLVAFLSIGCSDDDDPVEVYGSKLEYKQITSDALANNPIGNSTVRDIAIYTPDGYNPNGSTKYPVVYLLHGLPFSEKSFIDKQTWDQWIDPNGPFTTYPDFPQEGFRKWIDNLIETEQIDPMIIVMPNAASEKGYGFSWYTNSDLNGNFEDYIVNDVVNYIDSRYNTIVDRNGRALIGHSQGGYAAFKLGMKHSGKFGVVASHSGLLLLEAFLAGSIPIVLAENPDGMNGPDQTKFLTSALYSQAAAWSPNLNNPPYMVDLFFEYPSGNIIPNVWIHWVENDPFYMLDFYGGDFGSLNGIYFDVGEQDELGIGQLYHFLTQKLDAMGITYSYEIHDGGHFNKMFSRMEVSLKFCSNNMTN